MTRSTFEDRTETAADRSLVAQARRGGRVELGADDLGGLVLPAAAEEHERRVSADVIAVLLSDGLDSPALTTIVLQGVDIRGHLDLAAVVFDGVIAFEGCRFDEPVTLDDARLGTVRFAAGCVMPALSAVGVSTRGDLVLDGLRAGGVNLSRADVGGGLSMFGVSLGVGGADLRGARVARDASLTAAMLGGPLAAEGLRVEGLLRCAADEAGRFVAAGRVGLERAKIGGDVMLSGGMLSAGFSACRAQIGGDLYCCQFAGQPFVADGDVDLRGAAVAGDVAFSGATIQGEFLAEGLEVTHSLFLDRSEDYSATVAGLVNLQHARIGGALQLSGARVGGGLEASVVSVAAIAYFDDVSVGDAPFFDEGPNSPLTARRGIDLEGAHLSDVWFHGAVFEGAASLNLRGARLADLLFYGTVFEGPATSLNLRGACVSGSLDMLWSSAPGGVVLAAARLGTLRDERPTWPPMLDLRGCTYEGLDSRLGPGDSLDTGDTGAGLRLAWIELAETSCGFSPQPYAQLIAHYRREGRDDDARDTAYAAEQARRSQRRGPVRAWNAFLRATVGYGYRPLNTLALLTVLLIVGAVSFSHFHGAGQMTPVEPGGPRFVAVVYTLDRLIPVINFGLRDAFAITGAAQWLAYAYTAAGWLLTIAVVAGINAAVRRG